MRNILIATALAATSTFAVADAVVAKQKCFQRQERVCSTIGRGHDGLPRVACSYRTVQQCFQVPELRNKNISFRSSRR